MRRLVIRPGSDRRLHRFAARDDVSGRRIRWRSGPARERFPWCGLPPECALDRFDGAGSARRDGAARRPDPGPARVRLDRVLVRRESSGIPRDGGGAGCRSPSWSAAARRRGRARHRLLPGAGARDRRMLERRHPADRVRGSSARIMRSSIRFRAARARTGRSTSFGRWRRSWSG